MERFKDLRESDIDYLANAWDAIEDSDLPEESDFDAAEPIEVEKPEKREPIDYEGMAWDAEEKGLLDGPQKKKKTPIKKERATPLYVYARVRERDDGSIVVIFGEAENLERRDKEYKSYKGEEKNRYSIWVAYALAEKVSSDDEMLYSYKQGGRWLDAYKAGREYLNGDEAFIVGNTYAAYDIIEDVLKEASDKIKWTEEGKEFFKDFNGQSYIIKENGLDKLFGYVSNLTSNVLILGNLVFSRDGRRYKSAASSLIMRKIRNGGKLEVISDIKLCQEWQRFAYEQDVEDNLKVHSANTLEEYKEVLNNLNMKDVTILANPPYGFKGALGSRILAVVKDSVDFKEFIALGTPGCFQSDMKGYSQVLGVFTSKDKEKYFDASIPTLEVRRIVKEKGENLSIVGLAVEGSISEIQKLYKYNQEHEWIGKVEVLSRAFDGKKIGIKDPKTFNMTRMETHRPDYGRSLIFNLWFMHNTNHSEAWDIMWNYKLSTFDEFKNWIINSGETPDALMIKLPNSEWKKNLAIWMQSDDYEYFRRKTNTMSQSIKFIDQLIIPHVDWSRPWTTEEIRDELGLTIEERKRMDEYAKIPKSKR